MLIPFLAFPEKIRGRHIVFKMDNIAVVFGWQNGYIKNDKTATRVLKCTTYLAAYLGVTVHVEHVDRVSDELSALADELSKKKEPKCEKIRNLLKETEERKVDSYLNKWLEDPNSEELCRKLIEEIKEK